MKWMPCRRGICVFSNRSAMVVGLVAFLAFASVGRTTPTPPPEPPMAPIIVAPVDVDTDGTRVDDRLEKAIAHAQAMLSLAAATNTEKSAARQALLQPQRIELVFNRQITQGQIDSFLKAGGTIDHIFKYVSYGWTGSIALGKTTTLPGLMGPSLVGVVAKKALEKHMDEAAQCGRVRPYVWDLGYSGVGSGTNQITVAIIDTGVDGTHTDLAGREEYWKDETLDNHSSPYDLGHHGSHVAGIAVGTGAASGVAPSTISYTDFGDTAPTTGSFSPSPIHVPASVSSMDWTANLRWATESGVTAEVGLVNGNSSGGWGLVGTPVTGTTSPLVDTVTGQANPYPSRTNLWSPYVTKSGDSATGTATPRYAVSMTVSYAGVGDGYNVFRGVAPDCMWAGLKVFTDAGSGTSTDFDKALDDIVAQQVAHKIRVANMSLGIVGDPGISLTTRSKANTAAQDGIVMVISAGNDGDKQTTLERQIDDPGRAEYAITVGAVSDINQETYYSSEGFLAPGDASPGDDDTKPDLVAPGGSDYQSMIMSVDSNDGDTENSTGVQFSDAVPNDYRNTMGTSMSAPFISGCAALIIDALQQGGATWHTTGPEALADVLNVKMLLLMTATETNQAREPHPPGLYSSANPTLNRGGKDIEEGYGMINEDAAINAARGVLYTGSDTGTFGSGPFEKRCWARKISYASGTPLLFYLTVPAGGDFDLYVYSMTPNTYGDPVIDYSSTNAGDGVNESVSFTAPGSGTYNAYLVVKRVSGSGTWSIATAPAMVRDWNLFDTR